MVTLSLYAVECELGGVKMTMKVAAATNRKARKQTEDYSKTAKVFSVKRLGNVKVPLTLPAGL